AAQYYGIPFYVAAPLATIDFDCTSGNDIPIEHRHQDEVLYQAGPDSDGQQQTIRVASPDSQAINPAFDVTPANLVTAIITDKGIFKPEEIVNLKGYQAEKIYK
ncbi:MAG: S-methyl-5-thioribose-1-phosphate isomerase, partial [Gammaproteobacteria bacterium]